MKTVADEEALDWMGQDCWFCEKRPPVAGKSRHVKMKKLTDGGGTSVQILRSSVAVPRCAECAAGHGRASSKAMQAAFGGAFAVFLVVVVWSPMEMSGWWKALLVFLGFLPGAVLLGGTAGLPAGQKPESAADGFMAVATLERSGWVKDDQP